MKQSKSGPEASVCACGRSRTEAAAFVHQSNVATYVYRRCRCGAEWTESHPAPDRSQPVSTDEVIEVHNQLRDFEGNLRELLTEPDEGAQEEN
ncbi:MAG: hypothetical protein NVS9B1_11440 [Candidatus Dormibacteraceae bacterium]